MLERASLRGIVIRPRMRRAPPRTLVFAPALLALLLLTPAPLRADGGAVCAEDTAGPWIVTIFVSPVTVRVGPVDISVMVQDARDGAPLLDAAVNVSVSAHDPGLASISIAATHQQATNKLLYAAQFTLADAGAWDVRASVRRGAEQAETACRLNVAEPLPPWLAYWPYFALPPAAISLFVLHQWLSEKRWRSG